jgi:AcrR family transcriptional regulator
VTTEPSKKRSRQIVDAAARMFQERGYADTSVQDVAQAVGILKGSLYYYIDSKEDLLFRVLEDVHEDARHLVDDVAAMDAPPLERLAAYVRGHVEFNLRNLAKVAVYYHDFALLEPERREVIIEQRHLYERFVIGLIEEAQAAGDVDAGLDAHVAAYSALGMVNWVYTWYRPVGERAPSELADLIAEIVVGGLRAAGRRD